MQDTANHKKWRQGYGDDRVTMEHTLLCDVCCEGRRLEHPGGGEVSDSLKASNEARCQTFNPRSPSGTGTLPNQKTTRLRERMYTVIVRMVSCSICACPAVGHILVLWVITPPSLARGCASDHYYYIITISILSARLSEHFRISKKKT